MKEVPTTILPHSWVQVGGHQYHLHVLLQDEGPEVGRYMGMAIGETDPGVVITTDPLGYRIFDTLRSTMGLVVARHVPLSLPAEDVRASIEFAKLHGVKSPLR